MKSTIFTSALSAAVAFVGAVGLGSTAHATISGTPFEVALLGDLPYIPANMGKFEELKKQIDASDVRFAIHDGDFKSGGSLCSDEMFKARFELLNSFEKPLLYLPGDNEWTDCHRKSNGSYDPLERLAYLRKVFFMGEGAKSLGKKKLSVIRQGEVDGVSYPENFRMSLNRVQFTGLHIVGSNNNLGRNTTNDAEYLKRNKATIDWLKESYALAKLHHDKAMVIVIHANPHFDKPAADRTGFNEFISELETLSKDFPIPTLLVHGDTHRYQVDKPLPLAPGQGNKYPRWAHFTRLETFGSPNVHWIKLKIDLSKKWPFSYDEMLVEEKSKPVGE